jgi:hypothetical protein
MAAANFLSRESVMVRGLFLLGVMAAFFTVGCSGGSDALNSPTAARLKGLATMYLDCVATKGNSPANEAELKKHMRRIDAIQLNMVGFQRDKIDEAFVSLRDNQPFEMVYGVTPGTLGAKDAPIVAYEKTGVGGKKLVVNLSTHVAYVTEQQLQDMLKPKEAKK